MSAGLAGSASAETVIAPTSGLPYRWARTLECGGACPVIKWRNRSGTPPSGHERSAGGGAGETGADPPAVSPVRRLPDLPPSAVQLCRPASGDRRRWNRRGGAIRLPRRRAARLSVLAPVRGGGRPRLGAVPRLRGGDRSARRRGSAGMVGHHPRWDGSAASSQQSRLCRCRTYARYNTIGVARQLGLPADFLIDPDGTVAATHYGHHADDQWSVDELLDIHRLLRGSEAA